MTSQARGWAHRASIGTQPGSTCWQSVASTQLGSPCQSAGLPAPAPSPPALTCLERQEKQMSELGGVGDGNADAQAVPAWGHGRGVTVLPVTPRSWTRSAEVRPSSFPQRCLSGQGWASGQLWSRLVALHISSALPGDEVACYTEAVGVPEAPLVGLWAHRCSHIQVHGCSIPHCQQVGKPSGNPAGGHTDVIAYNRMFERGNIVLNICLFE